MKLSNLWVIISTIAICLVACENTNSTAQNPQPTANIESVIITNETTPTTASNITMTMTTNDLDNYSTWKLGFYSSRRFGVFTESSSGSTPVNPNLAMKICDNLNNCTNLIYNVESDISAIDQSAGYLTILTPQLPYKLITGRVYTISLLNISDGGNNLSSVPQSIFIVYNNNILNITTKISTYNLVDYNSSLVNSQIESHIANNWNNSIASNSNSIIIPTPVSEIDESNTTYTLSNGMIIHNNLNSDNATAQQIVAALKSDLNISATIDNQSNNTGIIIKQIESPSSIANNLEGYTIQISHDSITISAINNTGVYYALQSLRQLWVAQGVTLNGLLITDYPRFVYRGLMLDTARHFFTISQIESVIDIMATHKLNSLHMHFSDDEGFRIALSGYPSIESIADTRGYGLNQQSAYLIESNLDITNTANQIYTKANNTYAGTYSQSELRAIIDFANKRHITVIPEIDLPGHARALIKALPGVFVDPNDQSKYFSVQGYTDDILPVCTYNTSISVGPKFTSTMNDMLAQINSIFTNQSTLYAINNEVSVGGDEVAHDAWTNDSSCQSSWAGLSSIEKTHKFFKELSQQNTNITFSGWQQFVQTSGFAIGHEVVPPSRTGHVWVWNTVRWGAIEQAESLANGGYPVVLALADSTYFDLTYTPLLTEPGFYWGTSYADTNAALYSSVNAQIVIDALLPQNQSKVTGLEGALWSENIPTYNHLIYMALPKMAGLAEASWSPASISMNSNKQVNWQSLATRLGCGNNGFLFYLHKLYGVQYRGYPSGIKMEAPQACPSTYEVIGY